MSSLDNDEKVIEVLEEWEDFEYGIDEWIYNNYPTLKKIIPFNEEIKKLYLRRFPPENVLSRIVQNIHTFIDLEDDDIEQETYDFWKNVSYNPNITWEIMIDNPARHWNWWGISCNPNITWEIVETNLGEEWRWDCLSKIPDITWEIVNANLDQNWDWYSISQHPNITWEIVQNNPYNPWNWYGISQNPNITWEIIRDNPDKKWDWGYVSQKPNITWEIIRDNPSFEWNWSAVTINPNITWEIVEANPEYNWDWLGWGMSMRPNITLEIIKNNPDKDWDWGLMSKNPNITWEIIKNNPDRKWRWDYISVNPNITWEIIKNNPDRKWRWDWMSTNPNITLEIIKNNPDKPWDWGGISQNPNITWEIITEKKEEIIFSALALNKCQLHDHVVFKNYIRDVILPKKSNLIKKALRHSYYKPGGKGFKKGQTRFNNSLQEYKESFSFSRPLPLSSKEGNQVCLIPISMIKRTNGLVLPDKTLKPVLLKWEGKRFSIQKGENELETAIKRKATHVKAYLV